MTGPDQIDQYVNDGVWVNWRRSSTVLDNIKVKALDAVELIPLESFDFDIWWVRVLKVETRTDARL